MTDQGHETLADEDYRDLAKARDWAKGHFSDNPDLKYEPVAGKLRLIEAILANGWVEPSETWKLQALGICLGDCLSQELLMDWVIVDDEYGRSPALNWPGTTIYVFPQTLISKRIEHGEAVDVEELFQSTAKMVREMAFSGRYA
jgi:hypothetical protein